MGDGAGGDDEADVAVLVLVLLLLVPVEDVGFSLLLLVLVLVLLLRDVGGELPLLLDPGGGGAPLEAVGFEAGGFTTDVGATVLLFFETVRPLREDCVDMGGVSLLDGAVAESFTCPDEVIDRDEAEVELTSVVLVVTESAGVSLLGVVAPAPDKSLVGDSVS